jgi:hypothetical protein
MYSTLSMTYICGKSTYIQLFIYSVTYSSELCISCYSNICTIWYRIYSGRTNENHWWTLQIFPTFIRLSFAIINRYAQYSIVCVASMESFSYRIRYGFYCDSIVMEIVSLSLSLSLSLDVGEDTNTTKQIEIP